MKKHVLIILVLIFSSFLLQAKKVELKTAQTVAKSHYSQVNPSKSSVSLNLFSMCTTTILSENNTSEQLPLFYIFNSSDQNGFVIVSGDDCAYPILGYSTEGNYSNNDLPPNLRKWLDDYKKQLRLAILEGYEPSDTIAEQWEALKSGQPLPGSKSATSVNPLLTTTWNQSPYYNDLCPGGSVTGCVATAMAQVMKYWNYPTQGTGFHSYNEDDYGTLSANFGSTTYGWATMPNNLNGVNNAVATLMFHCGVSVEMNYSPEVSGAYVIMSQSPVQHCSEYAFTTYFGYDNSVQGVERANYTTANWIQLLKNELDASRPIEYAGFGSGGGHAFVCDGYDNNDYFHFNWGWGGAYDGFFQIDELDPGGTGIGGGSGGYNSGHQAVIGIKPPGGGGGSNYDLILYDNVSVSQNPISYGQSFTVHTDIANNGTGTFSGDFCAAIFDLDNVFIEFAQVLNNYSLEGGYHFNNGLDFSSSGSFAILPGSYKLGIFFKVPDGNWNLVSNSGSYTNMINFGVYYANDIELYQDFVVSGGTTIEQNQAFSVTLDVLNDGNSTFIGDFAVVLYDLEGNYAETVQTLTGGNLEPGYYYDDVLFESSGVGIEPGTYLMALLHAPSGGDWELSGSSYNTNPIKIIIQAAALNADIYENNDDINNAYTLPANFSGNSTVVETTGSNSHTGSDYDFYKVILPAGYSYVISCRAHDSYNSGNGQTYTNDVLWSYSTGGEWSDVYDDVMAGNITFNNGGALYLQVAPYFQGDMGTYLLSMSINRGPAGIEDIAASGLIEVYPNPATDKLHIQTQNNTNILQVQILDLSGRTIRTIENSNPANQTFTLGIEDIKKGSYFLILKNDDQIWQHQFIKGN